MVISRHCIMMELRQARRTLTLELAGQTAKFGLATFAIVTLLIINSNLRQLIICLGADGGGVARATPSRALTTPAASCQKHRFGQVTSLELDCCNSSVTIRSDGVLLVDYSHASSFVEWIRKCRRRDCSYKLNPGRGDCPKISRFGSDFLCLNGSQHVVYGAFGGFRLSDGDTYHAVSLLANECL